MLPVDLAANAASLGAHAVRAATIEDLSAALAKARGSDRTTVITIETDPSVPAPGPGTWWDVPVAEVADQPETIAARAAYEAGKRGWRPALRPPAPVPPAPVPPAGVPHADGERR